MGVKKAFVFSFLISCGCWLFTNQTTSTVKQETLDPIVVESTGLAVIIVGKEDVLSEAPLVPTSGHVEVEKVAMFTVTAYNTLLVQTSGNSCITANGDNICGTNGTVACSRQFEFGTKFRYDGITYRCNDRFNFRYDNPESSYYNPFKIDINFDKDVVGAKKFGTKIVEVEIIK